MKPTHKIDPVSEQVIEYDPDWSYFIPDSPQRLMMQTPIASHTDTALPMDRFEPRIAEAMAAAIRHTHRVARRDHIMADRVERVNHFVVDLRRELLRIDHLCPSSIRPNLVSCLTNKAIWADAGVLNATTSYYSGRQIDRDQIVRWLAMAKRVTLSTEATKEEIAGDLDELKSNLSALEGLVEEAQRINAEAEPVIAGLCALLDKE